MIRSVFWTAFLVLLTCMPLAMAIAARIEP